jgi:hypothetical protein
VVYVEGEHLLGRAWSLAVGALILLVAAGAATRLAAARPLPPQPTVQVGSVARLAPDGRSLDVDVVASCPERWTVVRAVVAVSQPQASGEAPFPLTCTGGTHAFTVTVQTGGAPFELGEAQAVASVVIQRGRTLQAQDSEVVRVVPTVTVDLAGIAVLTDGGQAVLIDVTTACNPGAAGRQSYVTVTQSPASGQGTFVPTCDGQQHTLTVRAQATTQELFQPGDAGGNAFVVIERGGDVFFGEDNTSVQILAT